MRQFRQMTVRHVMAKQDDDMIAEQLAFVEMQRAASIDGDPEALGRAVREMCGACDCLRVFDRMRTRFRHFGHRHPPHHPGVAAMLRMDLFVERGPVRPAAVRALGQLARMQGSVGEVIIRQMSAGFMG